MSHNDKIKFNNEPVGILVNIEHAIEAKIIKKRAENPETPTDKEQIRKAVTANYLNGVMKGNHRGQRKRRKLLRSNPHLLRSKKFK